MKGRKPKLAEPDEQVDAGVLDLMSRLRASLDQGGAKKTTRAKKTTAKRTRAKRKTA